MKKQKIETQNSEYILSRQISNTIPKGIYTRWKYDYIPFDKNTTPTKEIFKQFSFMSNEKKNYISTKMSNYENYHFKTEHSYSLKIPKLAIQALGIKNAMYLSEMSRLSMNYNINNYGYFEITRSRIFDDTGLSASMQRECEKDLEKIGFLDTYFFKNPYNRKFVKFNDDFAMKQFYCWKMHCNKHDYNIGLQYEHILSTNNKDLNVEINKGENCDDYIE